MAEEKKTAADYQTLGLMCGLECHQQLNTKKLFCKCPSAMREDEPDLFVRRRIRPMMSEMGEYDPAALEAFKRGQTFTYQAYSDTNCLVETDEEPPRTFNPHAFNTVLEIALMTGAKIMDSIYVMRKVIVDGSTTTSFQRTALVATNGRVEYEPGKTIGLDTIILEEDSARPVTRGETEVVYRLDRQGIPLIEISTAPDIRSPEDARKVALKIGELLRLTGRARRGLGTIRQDVNVSIRGGTRVELKGAQELDLLPEYVRREVQRQLALLEIRAELAKRGKPADLVNDAVDVSGVFKDTACPFLADGIKQGKKVLGLRLRGLKGIIGKEIQPGRRFGKEIAGYLKVKLNIAGLLHSEELPNYGITEADVKALNQKLGVGNQDAFVLVCEQEKKAREAMDIIVWRCHEAFKGVSPETRAPLPDGNNEYMRPLSGGARMYPETDLETVRVEAPHLEEIRAHLPRSAEERFKHYTKELKLSEKLANEMKLSNEARFFREMVEKGFDPTTVAVLVLEGLTKLKREGVETDNLSHEMVERVLAAQKEGLLVKESMLGFLKEWAKAPMVPFEEIASHLKVARNDNAGAEAEALVQKIVAKNEAIIRAKGAEAFQALMGDVMREARGKVPGNIVSDLLKKEIQARAGKK